MPDRGSPRVIALRCGACRTELPAASNDVAFRCPQCGRGWEIEETGLAERPAFYVMPPTGAKHSVLYLPYWVFPLSARVAAKDAAGGGEGLGLARRRAEGFQRAYVSGYAIHRPTYVGEWGLVYTRMPPDWEVRHGHGPDTPGGALSSTEAASIARHYILGEIDRACDLGLVDVRLELGAPELWAIPCYDLGARIRCPWRHGELPAAALDDLSEIRRASERREA